MSWMCCSRWPARLAVLALLVCALTPPKAGAVVDGRPAALDDRRFDAVGLVLTVQPWNPCGGWISGSCTLIAPNMVMLARHSVQRPDNTLPLDGARTHRVRFRRSAGGAAENHFGGNPSDCATPHQEHFIDRFVACPFVGVDIVLGILESVPVGITPIGVDITFQFGAGRPITLAGWGYDGRCIQTGEAWTLRTGAGVLPTQRFTSSYLFEYNQITFLGTCMIFPLPPLAPHNWAIGNVHDSGAPILIEVSSVLSPAQPELRVVGVVTSYTSAQRVTGWNLAGGVPRLENPAAANACADFDGVPGVTTNDLYLYISSWVMGEDRANIDDLPGVTLSDLLTYVQRFLGGC